MRVKILQRKGTGTVVLVYPSTLDEHRPALETLGRGARPAAGHDDLAMKRTGSGPPQGCYVVTTEEQRRRWLLARPRRPRPCPRGDRVTGARSARRTGAPGPRRPSCPPTPRPWRRRRTPNATRPGLAAVRELVAPGPRVDRVLAALESGVLPRLVCDTLRRALLQSVESGKEALEEALARAAMAVALPWRTLGPVRFDPAHLKQALDRTHGGLDRVRQDPAHRSAGGQPADPRRAHRGGSAPRRGRGDRIVGARRAPTHGAGPRRASPAWSGPRGPQDLTGRGRRRGARLRSRARGAGRTPHRASDPREGRRRPGTHRPGPAQGRGEKPGLHPRTARRGENPRSPARCSMSSNRLSARRSRTSTSRCGSICRPRADSPCCCGVRSPLDQTLHDESSIAGNSHPGG